MAAPAGNKHSAKWQDPVVCDRIVEALRKGNSRSTAFTLAGIHQDTGFDWLRYARNDPARYPELVELSERMDMAEQEFIADKIAQVDQAASSGTWQAAAWFAERRDPSNWGKRDTTKIETGDKPLVQVNIAVLENADTREASRDFLRRVTSPRADIAIGPGVGDEPSEAGPE